MLSSDALTGMPLVDKLTEEQRARVADLAREVTFAARERIFDENQPASSCWLIRSGWIVLDTIMPGRKPIVMQTLSAGDVLGSVRGRPATPAEHPRAAARPVREPP